MEFSNGEIWAAIIGTMGTVTAAIISPIISHRRRFNKQSKYVPLSPAHRQNSLFGKWEGIMDQKVGHKDVLHKHKMTLTYKRPSHGIDGTLFIDFVISDPILMPGDTSIRGKLMNTIFNGRICKSDYVNKDNNAIHFGTIYGKLSANGKEINGEFLGYGLVSERFVSGEIHLKKIHEDLESVEQ